MPWSAKAQELLREQYAPVGSSARASLADAIAVMDKARKRNVVGDLPIEHYSRRLGDVEKYTDAYRAYCWSVTTSADLKLAPFHLLATEQAVHVDKNHLWHMEQLATLCDGQLNGSDRPRLERTAYRVVDVTDDQSEREAIAWWTELTSRGGEGMVVKPLDFAARGGRGLVQPAVKCRGSEYLRIIYGPEYDEPEHLDRLRARGLNRKRSLALTEFALGVEALERFARREPLRRVHECVFGVLAMECEPVDPRL
jgi:protein phosphatase